MAPIAPGRMTHEHDGPVTVFLIGMRVTKPWRPDQWLPTFLAMPPMLKELFVNRALAARGEADDLGFLGVRTMVGWQGPVLMQFWRTPEHLYAYSSARDHEHQPAWAAFNARARKAPGAVGIWHETYAVPAGGHESVYVAMPATGLAAATRYLPIAASRRRHARTADNVPATGDEASSAS